MNIAMVMIPKVSTVFLHENDTVRQGLERFTVHGYTAIPHSPARLLPGPAHRRRLPRSGAGDAEPELRSHCGRPRSPLRHPYP